MIITKQQILNLNPCEERKDNFLHHYGYLDSFKLRDFVSLDNITYYDKVWVITKLMSHRQCVAFSLACARSVQHNIRKEHQEIIENSLKVVENWLQGNSTQDEIKAAESAAWSAASAAESAWSADSAARSAESAAESAWSAARSAAWSAARSADSAARSAAYAAMSIGYASDNAAKNVAYVADNAAYIHQRELNLILLADIIEDF